MGCVCVCVRTERILEDPVKGLRSLCDQIRVKRADIEGLYQSLFVLLYY